jgi:hypothetical protein
MTRAIVGVEAVHDHNIAGKAGLASLKGLQLI